MRILLLLIILCGIRTGVIAQKSEDFNSIDKTILQIPESLTASTQGIAGYINSKFSSPSDKSRAIFMWVATNIQYDVANMTVVKTSQNTNESIAKTLRTRKGVCGDYADLFNDIAGKVGIKCYVIVGYGKQKGVIDKIPHAWCAALIDSSWYLFDPTWGSGYVKNSKFVRELNTFYYKKKPEQFILSHMPFDPLWQFLNYPLTNQEFDEGEDQGNTIKRFFDFNDTLATYEKQSEIDRLISSNKRIASNGVKNSLTNDILKGNRKNIEVINSNQIVDQYNSAGETFNIGVNLLNKFINYRNNQFNPIKADSEIQQMIDSVETTLNSALEQLNNIKNPDSDASTMISQLRKSIGEATANVKVHKSFVLKYLKADILQRKSMFYKVIDGRTGK